MAIPNSRDYDAVDTGPLPHGTVNALQDAVVDHESRLDDIESDLLTINFGEPVLDNSGTSLWHSVSNDSDNWRVELPGQIVGRRIISWAAFGDTVVDGDIATIKLVKQNATETDIDTDDNSGNHTPAGSKTFGGTLGSPEEITSWDRYFMQVTLGTGIGQIKLYTFQVTYDRAP